MSTVEASGTVFVVIPVFNRLHFTRACLGALQRQTYPNVTVIVADGSSTDGTPEIVRRDYPEVIVLTSDVELWWSGATAMGVNHAMGRGNSDRDFVLFLNNDTEIPDDYIATLVRVARSRGAAVGAKVVDVRNPACCLDAGEYIDWENYQFPVKTTIADGELGCGNVDVLPGRGSLIPLDVIGRVGNIAADKFPHYIADYEFFTRVKRSGVPLYVTYETAILAHIDATGILPEPAPTTWRSAWNQLFSRRSMGNVVDHWRFIHRHAPAHLRSRHKRRLIWRSVGITPIGPAIIRVQRLCSMVTGGAGRRRSIILGIVLYPLLLARYLVQQIFFLTVLLCRIGFVDFDSHPRYERGLLLSAAQQKCKPVFLLACALINLRTPGCVNETLCQRFGTSLDCLIRRGLIDPRGFAGWHLMRDTPAGWSLPIMRLRFAAAAPFPPSARRARLKAYLIRRRLRSATVAEPVAADIVPAATARHV